MAKTQSGKELIKRMKAAVVDGAPLIGILTIKEPSVKGRYEFKALKPGYLSMIAYDGEHVVMEQHWLGKTFYTYTPDTRLCIKSNAENPFMPAELVLMGFEAAFSKADIYDSVGDARATMFEHHKVYGIQVNTAGTAGGESGEIFIDRTTYIPAGFIHGILRGIYSDVVLNAKLTTRDFEWKPPEDAKLQVLKVPK